MRLPLSTTCLAVGLATAAGPALASATTWWLDAAYVVGARGSTTPIRQLTLDGPAPWLHLDLSFSYDPAIYKGLDIVWFSANWLHNGKGHRIVEAVAGLPGAPSDKLWIEAANWDQVKSAGEWVIEPHLNFYSCIGTYGVGVCLKAQSPGLDVRFLVASTPVPEPATWALSLCGLGALALVGRRRRARS